MIKNLLGRIAARLANKNSCPNCGHATQKHGFMSCYAPKRAEFLGDDGWLHYDNNPCECKLGEEEVRLNLERRHAKKETGNRSEEPSTTL